MAGAAARALPCWGERAPGGAGTVPRLWGPQAAGWAAGPALGCPGQAGLAVSLP